MRRRDVLGTMAGAAGAVLLRSGGADGGPDAGTMITRPIPSSGEAMPVIGLGTWQVFDIGSGDPARQKLAEVLRLLVDAGGRMIDTSPMYGRAEAATGDLVAEAGLRPRVFLATKVWTSGREAGIAQMRRSAELLQQPGARPDPDPQSARLAHPSRHAAAHEGRGAGALYRHHALHDGVAARAGAHSRNRDRASISCSAATRSKPATPRSGCCRSRPSAGSRSSSTSRSRPAACSAR